MTASLPYLESCFSRFNALCFNGELPPVEFRLSNARSYLGRMEFRRVRGIFGFTRRCDDFLIRISTAFDLPENVLEDVVIHEMIHYWIAYRQLRDSSSHGRLFRERMNFINRNFGRNVRVSHKASMLVPSGRTSRRPRCVCLSELPGGEYGVTVCTEAMMPRLKRLLPRCFNIRSSGWFVSSDSFFDRFPLSRTPKIYRITPEEALRLRELEK